MNNWFKKLFCRCRNSVDIISNRKGILQFGKCNKCGSYYLINTIRNECLKLSENEYIKNKLDLDRFDNCIEECKDDEKEN